MSTIMSEAQKAASKIRWANTGPEERARMGKIHRAALLKYWKTRTPAMRSKHAAVMARGRWGKKV